MEPLTQEQIEKELTKLEGWTFNEDKIKRDFSFKDFKTAMGFIVRVAFEAEQQAHHPELHNVYNSVSISLSTHDAGDKVTAKDIELARAIDRVASR